MLHLIRRRLVIGATRAILLAVVASVPQLALADSITERAALERLIHELDLLEAQIQAAEAESSATARIQFQYDWLRTDLTRVKAGIREYLDSVPLTPRVIEPLAGDYIG